jgi:hypothetical protein
MKKEGTYMNDTITTFLTSSLNVELVHIILKTITKKVGRDNPNTRLRGQNNFLNKKDFDEVMEHKLEQIRIRDPKSWSVAKLPEFFDNTMGYNENNSTSIYEDLNETVLNEEFVIMEHAPKVFKSIRDLDNIG